MERVPHTYYLVRLAEEQFGPPVAVGDRLVYRAESRIPWLDPIFDLPRGTVCEVLKVDYDPAVGEPDFDPCDNHYHYWLRGMEEHGGLSTTEVVALFDLEGEPEAFVSVADGIMQLVCDR